MFEVVAWVPAFEVSKLTSMASSSFQIIAPSYEASGPPVRLEAAGGQSVGQTEPPCRVVGGPVDPHLDRVGPGGDLTQAALEAAELYMPPH